LGKPLAFLKEAYIVMMHNMKINLNCERNFGASFVSQLPKCWVPS
jgi:hypothetical protein